jgi:hypothetical protein
MGRKTIVRKAEVARAIKGALAAGVGVITVEIDTDGKIIITAANVGTTRPDRVVASSIAKGGNIHGA